MVFKTRNTCLWVGKKSSIEGSIWGWYRENSACWDSREIQVNLRQKRRVLTFCLLLFSPLPASLFISRSLSLSGKAPIQYKSDLWEYRFPVSRWEICHSYDLELPSQSWRCCSTKPLDQVKGSCMEMDFPITITRLFIRTWHQYPNGMTSTFTEKIMLKIVALEIKNAANASWSMWSDSRSRHWTSIFSGIRLIRKIKCCQNTENKNAKLCCFWNTRRTFPNFQIIFDLYTLPKYQITTHTKQTSKKTYNWFFVKFKP